MSSIRMLNRGLNINFDRDTKVENKPTEVSEEELSASSLLRKKHKSIVPNVMLQRKTVKSSVVPLVLPL